MIKLGSKLEILKTANKATALLPKGKISKVASIEDNSEYSNDFIYFIARALTANVPNANGDYFPDDELEKSYESFIGKNLHLNHDADDVAKAVGKIIDAWYVKTDGDIYVVCLCKVDRKLHPELARNIETGIIDSVSMGCSCQECECSICGKKAHNEAEFCDHLRHFLGREIDVNGEKKKVSSINRGITFNELSLVGDPADTNAHMYQIYANKRGDNMKKKATDVTKKQALMDDKPEEAQQDQIKPEIEKAIEDKVETVEEVKVEEPTKEEVKEEIKETEEKIDQAIDTLEEKKEDIAEIKEELKDIKEEPIAEDKVEETKEEETVVEKEESCGKKAEEETAETVTEETKEEEIKEAVEDKVEEVKQIVEEKLEEAKEEIKEEVEEPKEEDKVEEKESCKKSAETEEEIKEIEEIKEKAEEAIEEDKKEETVEEEKKEETVEETKEEVVEEKKEEEKVEEGVDNTPAETVEEVQEKVEEIVEEVVAEIGDIFSPVKDETKEFTITDIYEEYGEKFVETEVEGKKKVYALKNVKLKKSATAPAKPTTAPSAGMKWVFNKNTNAWEQKPENTKTVEVEAADVKKATTEYKYTLIKAGTHPRWIITDRATNKLVAKFMLADLPKEAGKFDYKKVLASTIKAVGLAKVATVLKKKAVQVNDKFELFVEGAEPKTLTVENISINDTSKETFIRTNDENIFTLSKFLKMMEDGELKKIEEVKEEVKEVVEDVKEEQVETVSENDVDMVEDTVPMNQDETAEPMNDLQSSVNQENVMKAIAESMKNKNKFSKKADAGDGELQPAADPTPDFKLAPEVQPTEANTLANGEPAEPEGVIPEVEEKVEDKVVSPKDSLLFKLQQLGKAIEDGTITDDQIAFADKEIQDAIDFINGKPIEEIENDAEEIMEFSDIKWEDTDGKETLPQQASIDVDDINWNNINARADGAMILSHIYNAKPVAYKVAMKKVNKMQKTASKLEKVSFVDVLRNQLKAANQKVAQIQITAELREKKDICETIVKQAMAKGLVQVDSQAIKNNILAGMTPAEARELAVRKAADEQVKNLMAMDKASVTAYKKTIESFVSPRMAFKKDMPNISRITASADYEEESLAKQLPWSHRR